MRANILSDMKLDALEALWHRGKKTRALTFCKATVPMFGAQDSDFHGSGV